MTKAEIKKWLKENGYENRIQDFDKDVTEEEAERGFYLSSLYCHEDYPDGVEEVQSIDILIGTGIPGFPETDAEAVALAKAKGYKFINDLPNVEADRFIDTPENRQLLMQKPFCVKFNVAGSVTIMAKDEDEARDLFIEGIRSKGSIMEEVCRVLQDHIRHINVDNIEEMSGI